MCSTSFQTNPTLITAVSSTRRHRIAAITALTNIALLLKDVYIEGERLYKVRLPVDKTRDIFIKERVNAQ